MMPYEIALDEKASSEMDVDFFFCSFKLNNGDEIFSSARSSGDTIVLRYPVRVGFRVEGNNSFLSFGRYNPFSEDEFTAIHASSVHHSNTLSEKYVLEYKKAVDRLFFDGSSNTSDEDDDQFDTDSQRMIVVPSASKMH